MPHPACMRHRLAAGYDPGPGVDLNEIANSAKAACVYFFQGHPTSSNYFWVALLLAYFWRKIVLLSAASEFIAPCFLVSAETSFNQ